MKILKRNTSEIDFENQEKFDNTHIYTINKTHIADSSITIFDAKSHSEKEKKLKLPLLDFGTSIIDLPNSKLFCCGSSLISKGITCIIDTKNFSYTLLPSIPNLVQAEGVYYENKVYIFGGYKFHKSSTENSFDLLKNKWIMISSLPIDSIKCSCIVFNQKILLSGMKHSCIYLYDFDIDSYSETSKKKINLRAGICKFLITDKIRAYLIGHLGSIYESEILDEYSWKKVKDIYDAYFYYDKMHYTMYNNQAYIWISIKFHHDYYRFNLDTKTLERVKINNCLLF